MSSVNSRARDQELFIALSVRVVNWRVKAKLSALELYTLYLAGKDYPVSTTWTHFISYREHVILSVHEELIGLAPKRTCTCFTCLLRCIDHTNVIPKLEGTQRSSEDSEHQGSSDLWDETQSWETAGSFSPHHPIGLQCGLLTGSTGWFFPLSMPCTLAGQVLFI